jgi:hypothetical protein
MALAGCDECYVLVHGLNALGDHLHPLAKVFTVHWNVVSHQIEVHGYTCVTTLCNKDCRLLEKILVTFSDRPLYVKAESERFLHEGAYYQRCHMLVKCVSQSELKTLTAALQTLRYKYEGFDQIPWGSETFGFHKN